MTEPFRELLSQLDKRSLRLFAADCAEHVLPLFERACPDNDRPRRAIAAARDYTRGDCTFADMITAGDEAEAAAWYAAVYAASPAAWYAASCAASCGAWSPAVYVARGAERQWQTERLRHYVPVEVNR